MRVWRLTRRPFADLSGTGGLYAGGRWHAKGRPVVYLGGSPALCVLEFVVNAEAPPELLPDDYVLMTVTIPDTIPRDTLTTADLPDGWRTLDGRPACRALGEAWAEAGEAAVLQVPSAVVPAERTLILNPRHADAAAVTIDAVEPFTLDPRLWRHAQG